MTGICLGLATLSKYHVLFIFAGAFCLLAPVRIKGIGYGTRGHTLLYSSRLLSLRQYCGGTIIITGHLLFSRVQGAGTGGKFQLHIDWFLRSILGQALVLLPWIWVPTIRELFRSYKLRLTSKVYSFSFWLSILPIVFFTAVTLWADLQYHFHWQAPGYMMLFIPLGFAIDKKLSGESIAGRTTRRWLRFSVCFTVITIGVVSIHMVTGFLAILRAKMDGK